MPCPRDWEIGTTHQTARDVGDTVRPATLLCNDTRRLPTRWADRCSPATLATTIIQYLRTTSRMSDQLDSDSRKYCFALLALQTEVLHLHHQKNDPSPFHQALSRVTIVAAILMGEVAW